MLISLLPDTGSALAVQQFLALRLAPQDSEKNQRHIWLRKICRILVLTLKKGFQALLLQILYAAFREQEKRPSIPQLSAESVWVGCWAVTSEFPQVISWFQLSRTSSPSRCPVAGHWTWDPLSFAALSYQPLWPPGRYDVKPHWQHHATFGEIWLLKISMSSANLFGWLGEAQTRMAANIYGGKQS